MAPGPQDLSAGAVDRRRVLEVGLCGAGLFVLGACARTSTSPAGEESSPATGESAATSASPSGPARAGTDAQASNGLVAVDDVPVGGAVSAEGDDGPLIVARPTGETVVAFSAICTHQGCTVAPAGDEVRCPCHGSVYEAATGKNVDGPAPSPLPKVGVRVVDGQVVLA